LFIFCDDYLNLLKDLSIINKGIVFDRMSGCIRCGRKVIGRKVIGHCPVERKIQDRECVYKRFPIFRLGDSELNFSHYDNPQNCIDDWNRRLERFNKVENIIFSFNYIYEPGCERYSFEYLLKEFHKLDLDNKISWSPDQYEYKNNFKIQRYENDAFQLGKDVSLYEGVKL